MKRLSETSALMNSADYKERFEAEYYQLEYRYVKLVQMVRKWDVGELNFTPTCSREIYDKQLEYMKGYLHCLLDRAIIENVHLELDSEIQSQFSIKAC